MRYVAGILLVLATGCTVTPPRGGQVGADLDTACNGFVKQAAEVDAEADEVDDLDLAIEGCGSIAELESVSRVYPTAFDGVPVRTFVANRCAANDRLADAPICRELRPESSPASP